MNEYQQRVLSGRKDFLKLVLKQDRELLKIYEQAAKQITYKLQKAKPGGLSARYLNELDKSINQYIAELRSKLRQPMRSGIEASSELAANVQFSFFDSLTTNFGIKSTFNKMFTQISDSVARQLISGNYYEDGKSLDQRLWDLTAKNAKDIDRIIKINVAQGVKAGDLAKQLKDYINPLETMTTKTRVPGINKSIAYQAQRLSRTSLTHAHNETYIQGSKSNPFNLGLKWNLSPSHYDRQVKKWGMDICDEYAGKVYKPDEYPVAHPNCLCYPTEETVPIEKARDELTAWIKGESNPKLDKWYKDYGEEFGLTI